MKTKVAVQNVHELEIRPARMLAEYHDLVRRAVESWAAAGDSLEAVGCPGCDAGEATPAFDRFGLSYRLCARCSTLFASPRPSAASLRTYYDSSAPARFWREQVLPATRPARAEKISQPRAQWVVDGLAEHAARARTLADISATGSRLGWLNAPGTPGSYALDRLELEGAPSGARVIECSMDELPEQRVSDAITAFDVLDRVFSVPALLSALRKALRPGGLLFLTGTSVTGFDLQVLWDRSPTITPPDKLNLLSIDAFRARFGGGGFELIELSTPGMFDVETVQREVASSPGAAWPRVVRTLMHQLDDQARQDLQEFLQAHRLGSFVRLMARAI